jgi:hypothetical protein
LLPARPAGGFEMGMPVIHNKYPGLFAMAIDKNDAASFHLRFLP